MISGIILAAGASERMGRPKQLLELAGKPMLEHVVRTFLASGLQEVIVVVNPAIGWRPSKSKRVHVVVDSRSGEGISGSVKAGIESTSPACEAAVIGLGDKPLVTRSTIEKLILFHKKSDSEIIVPTYRGKRGNPILFRRSFFPAIGRLSGDEGAKVLIESGAYTLTEVPVRDLGVILDVDTPSDLRRAERLMFARARLAERKSRK